MPKNSNQTIVLGGDFNLPGIDWDNGVVNPKAANKSQCELLLSSLDTHALAQIHKEPTREENILDLLITNKPGLIKSSHSVPGISDHCAVVTELDIDPPTQNSFWHQTIPDWNSLPAAAIESKTVAAFKSQLVD